MALAILIKTDSEEFKQVDVTNWRDISKLLECDIFSVTRFTINNKVFTAYCDDCGLLKDNPIVTVISSDSFSPRLVGNILIMQTDEYGEDRDLTVDEYTTIEYSSILFHEWNGKEFAARRLLLIDPLPAYRLCGDCKHHYMDIDGEDFCSAIDTYPTVTPTMECLLRLYKESKESDK